MKQYLDQLQYILDNGQRRKDRTGTGTLSVFGMQTRYNLSSGFPTMTTKKLFWKGVVRELLWFLRGDTNIKYLVDHGIGIWNDDAYRDYVKEVENVLDHVGVQFRNDPGLQPMPKDKFIEEIKNRDYNRLNGLGDLGPTYGKQWRDWDGIDQIAKLIEGIKNNPYSRRHMLSAWNVSDIDKCVLPPCHFAAQFYVSDRKLSCHMFQRSMDAFLGESFNIASYALLTHMIAQVCELGVQDLIISIGDAHIYLNHIEQAKEQLTRKPYPLPKLWLNPEIKNIDDFKYEDIKLLNYKYHPAIKAPLSVGT